MSDAISDERARELEGYYGTRAEWLHTDGAQKRHADTAALIRECLHRRQQEQLLRAIDIRAGGHSFPGCGNHACMVRKPGGQGTNTSCRCSATAATQAWQQCVRAILDRPMEPPT